jgi:hypothetical protein
MRGIMTYERTGNLLHNDLAALLEDLKNQAEKANLTMVPADSLHGLQIN